MKFGESSVTALDIPGIRFESLKQHRSINAIGFGICTFMLAYAWYLEYYQGLIPCPLCLVQRFGIGALGLVFMLAALHVRRRQFYGLLIMVVAAGSAVAAGYQVWLQHQPLVGYETCLPPLNVLLNAFPLTEAIGIVLENPGNCGQVQWSLLGLSIPVWTLIAFIGLGTLGTASNWVRDLRAC